MAGKYWKGGGGGLGPKSLCPKNHPTRPNFANSKFRFPTILPLVFGASIGQVWTRHLAPAAPASRPSSPSQFLDCACHADSAMQFLSLPSALNGVRVGLLLQGSGLGGPGGEVPPATHLLRCTAILLLPPPPGGGGVGGGGGGHTSKQNHSGTALGPRAPQDLAHLQRTGLQRGRAAAARRAARDRRGDGP